MIGWLQSMLGLPRSLPDAVWEQTLTRFPFLTNRSNADQTRLRILSLQFLAQKQFSGAQGLVVTDDMAVAIAAQACLPVLNLGLKLYDDFMGIVVHPGAMRAQRSQIDAAGVHHAYAEILAGEAMEGGPVTLSWEDVVQHGDNQERGYNVVIHEFVHKLDMRDGTANGCPPLPSRTAKVQWQSTMQKSFDAFRDQVVMAERFGAQKPWLSSYGATSPTEFFAVTAEAYFVSPVQFSADFASVSALFDSYFGWKSSLPKTN